MTMKRKRRYVTALLSAISLLITPAFAQGPSPSAQPAYQLPAGVTEEMLAPPPVPRFMLEKPAKPLTVEEMQQQAREAERRAGIQPKATDPSETKPKQRKD
jgi:hypothetical protein